MVQTQQKWCFGGLVKMNNKESKEAVDYFILFKRKRKRKRREDGFREVEWILYVNRCKK